MMNYLKKFESFQTHDEIHEICKQYKITNYTINEDGSIDVNDDVDLNMRLIKKIPLRFNKVSGYFDCSSNRLTTLEGAPQSVGDWFNCSRNNLTTLKYAPQSVGGDFNCYNNFYLKSLEHLSKYIATDEVNFEYTSVYEIFELLDNYSLEMIRLVNDFKVIVDDKINIEILNAILYDQGKPPVESVKGYINI